VVVAITTFTTIVIVVIWVCLPLMKENDGKKKKNRKGTSYDRNKVFLLMCFFPLLFISFIFWVFKTSWD
jgi:predicted MFS family arabinose efflux permease